MLKSLPFLTAWNNQANISNALGALAGFCGALFFLSAPANHALSIACYIQIFIWTLIIIVTGVSIVYVRFYSFNISYADELVEPLFLQTVRKRILQCYIESTFLTGTFVYFSWFLVRTQRQWTEMNVFIAEAILFAGYGLFAMLSIRDENVRIVSMYHALPELEEGHE